MLREIFENIWEWIKEWWVFLTLGFAMLLLIWSLGGYALYQRWNKCVTYTTTVAGQNLIYGPMSALSMNASNGKYMFEQDGVYILLEPKDTIVKVEECK